MCRLRPRGEGREGCLGREAEGGRDGFDDGKRHNGMWRHARV